jgi:hypothetical protein
VSIKLLNSDITARRLCGSGGQRDLRVDREREGEGEEMGVKAREREAERICSRNRGRACWFQPRLEVTPFNLTVRGETMQRGRVIDRSLSGDGVSAPEDEDELANRFLAAFKTMNHKLVSENHLSPRDLRREVRGKEERERSV